MDFIVIEYYTQDFVLVKSKKTDLHKGGLLIVNSVY